MTTPIDHILPPQRPDARTAGQQLPAGTREWIGLGLLALPTILLGLDLTLLHLALPALAVDLRASSVQSLWIVDIYGLVIAGLLVTMGALGDRIGRRRLLMIGAAGFGAASLMAAYAPTPSALIAARALLGIAGATLMPSTLALISNMFVRREQRALAIGVWATMFALGMAAGPLVGGLLLERYWWGAAFLVALPVVALLLLAAPSLIPEYRPARASRLDLHSAVLSLLALLPVIYGFKHMARYGAGAGALLAILSGVFFACLFVRRQRRLPDPLVDLSLFASRAFRMALLVLLGGLVGVGGTMLLVTQYLQLVVGLSPSAAGAWMAPPALAMLVAGIVAPLLARTVPPGRVMAGGLAVSVVGYAMLALLARGAHDVVQVSVAFSLVYLGLGTIASLGTDLVVGAAPPEKAGAASAMSETVQELGIAIGIAILGSVTTAVYRREIGAGLPQGLADEVRHALGDSLAGANSVAHALPDGLLVQAQDAFIAGLNAAAGASVAGIALLAALAAWKLRDIGAAGGHD